MGVQITVYIGLQQSDLHCISAFEAIHQSLGFSDLKHLSRYRTLTLSVADLTEKDAVAHCKDYLSNAFDLVNPNKETVFTDIKPTSIKSETAVIGFNVRNSESSMRQIRVRSMMKFPKIQSIEQGLLWVLTVSQLTNDDDALLRSVDAVCGATTSRSHGLLVNPLFETYSIVRIA